MTMDESSVRGVFELACKYGDPLFCRRRYESSVRAEQGDIIDALIADGGQATHGLAIARVLPIRADPCWSYGTVPMRYTSGHQLARDATGASVLTTIGL